MKTQLKPVSTESLKEAFVTQIEEMILSGSVRPGTKLPPEREMAELTSVSRPIVREGLLDLASKGLIEMRPRFGNFVTDFRISGSAELLSSLWRYKGGRLAAEVAADLEEFRVAVEGPAAERLARVATAETVEALREARDEADAADPSDAEATAFTDYEFHFAIALHSGNTIYPMIMNSFRSVYLAMLTEFFRDETVVPRVRATRRELLAAIAQHDEAAAREWMQRLASRGYYATA